MGECCSAQINLVNELSSFLILDEDKITTMQASIRRYLSHKIIHSSSLKKSNLQCSLIETEVDSSDAETHSKTQFVENYQFLNGKYSGNLCKCCKIMNGNGKFIYHDSSCYNGNWINGKANGQGKMIYANGDIYEGCWKDDQVHGLGKYTRKNGASYFGEWKEDQQHGFGIEKWPDGSMYEGNFIMGKKEGKGKFIWADKSFFEGEFSNNLIDGFGTYKWPDGRKYIGQLKRNKINGEGRYEISRSSSKFDLTSLTYSII